MGYSAFNDDDTTMVDAYLPLAYVQFRREGKGVKDAEHAAKSLTVTELVDRFASWMDDPTADNPMGGEDGRSDINITAAGKDSTPAESQNVA